MSCDHLFHIKCIDEWLLEHSYRCPICRKSMGESYAHTDENSENIL